MKELPRGWKHIPLGDLCRFKSGGSLGYTKSDYQKEGYAAFSASGQDGYVDDAEYDCNAVILSSIGARCGKTFLATGKWTSLANTQLIFPDEDQINVRYLWYFTNDERRWPRSGSAQPFIKPRDGKAIPVPLPPLATQRAIVEWIEALFGEIDDAEADLEQAGFYSDEPSTLRQAILAAAFRGELIQ